MADEVRSTPGVPPSMLRRATRRRVRTAAILGLVAALVGYGGFAGVQALTRPSVGVPASFGQCSWEVVSSPNQEPERLDNQLNAVAAFSDDDVWAVGSSYVNQEGGENFPLTMHWDGTSWAVVPVPDSYGHEDVFAVDGSSPQDIWGIGLGHEALHWDGQTWSTVPLADPGTTYWHLEAVSALAPDDVWAVGIAADQPGTFGGGDRALIEHWDGQRWIVSETLPADSRLVSVVGLSPDEAWAVGSTGHSGTFEPLVLRWDGTRWEEVPTGVTGQASLSDISESPSGDLWAVGLSEENGHGRTLTLRCAGV